MNTSHTPGPWHFMTTQEPSGEISAIGVHDPYNLYLASVELHHHTVADPIANARLIAAAPDLLAALYEINQMLIGGAAIIHAKREKMLDIAHTAISKAEGK